MERMSALIGDISRRSRNRLHYYDGGSPIFETFGVQKQIDDAFHRQVWLKCGGYIVIDETEALVAIDVNTGRNKGGRDVENSIFENCPYCQGRGVVKTSMTTSVELHRTLNSVMRKYQDSVHEFRVILNPDVLRRLKEEDEELLIELERRYAGKLMFRGDPSF